MLKHIFILCFICAFQAQAKAQAGYEETIRQYVLEKLRFFYVDAPGTANPSNITALEIDKVTIAQGGNIANPVWTSANNDGLKTMLKRLLCDSVHGGDILLQGRVANVLLITDKKVLVFLYNDMPNVQCPQTWKNQHPYCENGNYEAAHNKASWPCAFAYRDTTLPTAGEIGIGAYFFNPARPGTSGGWSATDDKMHVFIHELVHTQLIVENDPTLGTVNKYGTGGHSFDELLPSKNTAFNEGIATAFALRYHRMSWNNMTDWFNTNRSMIVDNLTVCGTATNPPGHCLQTRLSNAAVPVAAGGSTTQQSYLLRDIPEDIIMHNENMYAYMLYEYMDQFRSEMLLVRNVKASQSEIKRASFAFVPLFKEMVKSTKRYTNPTAPAATPARGHVLTMSILDYYTGFKMTNLGKLSGIIYTDYRNLPDQQNYFDYFSPTGRQEILRYRAATPNVWSVPQQLDRFATYLHVR